MSFLYYENLPEVHSSDVASAIMYSTFNGIKPYFSFIDKTTPSTTYYIFTVDNLFCYTCTLFMSFLAK